MALQSIGAFAQPSGASAGRSVGNVIGGALGAAAIRCAGRSASRGRRSSSTVRFADTEPPSLSSGNAAPPTSITENGELRATMQANSSAILTAQAHATREANEALMDNMAKMFNMSRQETIQREEILQVKLEEKLEVMNKQIESKLKNDHVMSTQVDHLTATVTSLRDQLDTNADFAVDAMQQMRDEFNSRLTAMHASKSASNAGGDQSASSQETPMANSMGEPDHKDEATNKQYATQCAYCLGSVPKVIAKHGGDCDLYFHPGHYQTHKEEWPCPMVDHDLCPWCANRINEEDNVHTCEICQYELHTACYANHCPCPDGWTTKNCKSDIKPKDLLSDLEEPSANVETERPAIPVDPEAGSLATALYQKFMADMEAIQKGEIPQVGGVETPQQYPSSPGGPGGQGGTSTALVNLGVAPGATLTGHVVQYGKPREADSVKLMAFPKPGTSFEKWWENCFDSISSATSFCTEAYRWALECEKTEMSFDELSQSGGFVRLDALLLTALMDCIPGDTHLLRQDVKKAKTEQRQNQQRNITGRQV